MNGDIETAQEQFAELKAKANQSFKCASFEQAINEYTEALKCNCTVNERAIVLSNRAAAHLKLEEYHAALEDADDALTLDNGLVKAHFRKALALEGLSRPRQALDAAKAALKLEPQNKATAEMVFKLAPYTDPLQRPAFSRALLPGLLAAVPFEFIPSADGVEENLLIMFHGLGDGPKPFAKLASTMKLPQTSALVLGAPYQLPFSDGGRSWFTVFDEDFELIVGRKGEERRMRSLEGTRNSVMQLLHNLTLHCGWESRRIHLFGYSQGGTVALEMTRLLQASEQSLGSCIGVAAALLQERLIELEDKADEQSPSSSSSSSSTNTAPILLLHGSDDDVVVPNRVIRTEKQLIREGYTVIRHMEPDKSHAMVSRKEESQIMMAFFAKHLSSVPTGEQGEELIEVTPGTVSIEKS